MTFENHVFLVRFILSNYHETSSGVGFTDFNLLFKTCIATGQVETSGYGFENSVEVKVLGLSTIMITTGTIWTSSSDLKVNTESTNVYYLDEN